MNDDRILPPLARRRRFLARASAAGAALAVGPRAFAQANWPQSPIKMIIPFAAGGSTDILTRMIGKIVGERIGQPIVVDNRGGAGGIIGTAAIAKSQPDGYTFGMTTVSSIVSAPIINTKVPFDVDREIAFVQYGDYWNGSPYEDVEWFLDEVIMTTERPDTLDAGQLPYIDPAARADDWE